MKNLLVLLSALVLVMLPVHAHHSSAGRYDSGTIIEVEGTVVEVKWRNPHAHLIILAEDANGVETEWEVEGASPTALDRSGLKREFLDIGDRIRVAGWAPMTERRETFMQNILLASGEEFVTWPRVGARWSDQSRGDFAYWSQTEGDRSQPQLGIFRVWSSSFAFPGLFNLRELDMNDFPLTKAGRDRVAAHQAAGENLVSTQGCTPKGMPLIMEQPYPMEFVREGENIVLRLEEYDVVRTIFMKESLVKETHLNQSEAVSDMPSSPFGYSTGSWDGDTLVVKTTRLNWPLLTQSGAPLSEEAVLEERFTPAESGSRLDYQLVVTDPAMYTEPVTRGKQWLYLPDQKVRPYECAVSKSD